MAQSDDQGRRDPRSPYIDRYGQEDGQYRVSGQRAQPGGNPGDADSASSRDQQRPYAGDDNEARYRSGRDFSGDYQGDQASRWNQQGRNHGPSHEGFRGQHDQGHQRTTQQGDAGGGHGGHGPGYSQGGYGNQDRGYASDTGYGRYGGGGRGDDRNAPPQREFGQGYRGNLQGASGAGTPHDHQFDPDYHQWRTEQLRNLDNDYQSWRQDRYQKFSEEFNNWRNNRKASVEPSQGEGQPPASSAQGTSTPLPGKK